MTMDREELFFLLDRRRFLAGSAALAAVPFMPWEALAQAQTPHTFTQGEMEVTIISDGSLILPLNVMAGGVAGAACRDSEASRLDLGQRRIVGQHTAH